MVTDVEPFWAPHPGPQTEFLSDTCDETLYGGAAGGGKSDAMIVDALGLNQLRPDGTIQHAIDHPKYRAIIFRKQSTDLTEVIDRCLELYPQLVPGIRYMKVKRWFVFPSGARIEFGSVNDPGDELNFKSRQFQYIGWEELTEHPTSAAYEYLMSRCRGPEELPKLIRATTNPDGPGHTWVKKWWRIGDDGRDVPRFEDRVEVDGEIRVFSRRFIAAKVQDNPAMDTSYKFRLANMSEDKRRALLEGRWDIVNIDGVIFQRQIETMYREQRISEVPYVEGYPVNTFWDFGNSDATAIWFHQRVGNKDQFIDYVEDRHQPFSYFVKQLQMRPYVYGVHYLPHDAAHRRQHQDENLTIQEMLEDLGLLPTEVVPRCSTIAVGLEAARQSFSTVWIDRVKCEAGLDALKNYRYRYDNTETVTQTPLHNWASNGADAFRQFGQMARGEGFDKPPALLRPSGLQSAFSRAKRVARKRRDRSWVV